MPQNSISRHHINLNQSTNEIIDDFINFFSTDDWKIDQVMNLIVEKFNHKCANRSMDIRLRKIGKLNKDASVQKSELIHPKGF